MRPRTFSLSENRSNVIAPRLRGRISRLHPLFVHWRVQHTLRYQLVLSGAVVSDAGQNRCGIHLATRYSAREKIHSKHTNAIFIFATESGYAQTRLLNLLRDDVSPSSRSFASNMHASHPRRARVFASNCLDSQIDPPQMNKIPANS